MLPVSVDGTSTYAQTIAYDSANRMIQMIRGANKVNTVFTYNNWNVDGGRLLNLTSTQVSTGDPLQNQTYDYDSVGNINTITDSLSGPQTQTFTYDELDRLLSSSVTGGTDGLYTEGYSYDSATGNLASKNNVNYTAYDANHKHAVTSLSNGNTYGYDQNGNMTSRHVFEGTEFKDYTLNYDAENRLVSVSGNATASFAYDGDGKQIKATVNGITAVYVGQHYEVKNNIVTKYYFAGTTRLAVRTDGTLRFLLGDHLGSSSVTTNASGAKTASALYKAFGETRYALGNLNTDYHFTGQREEVSLGIYFFNARWYDGSLGRFLSPDTIVPTSTQGTQAWDRYAFVNNNPVRYTDPTGHFICPAFFCAMPTFWAMFAAGLNQESHFDITGEGLEKIKQDPAIKAAQEDIMNSKNPVKVEPQRVDLAGDGSLLGQARDETFWMVNVGHLSATNVQVNDSGKTTITWELTDIFEFRPLEESEHRSDAAIAKNDFFAFIFGGLYHDILGATDEMTSSATWTTTICPDGSTSESGWCSGDEKE